MLSVCEQAILRFLDRLIRIWLGVTKMWLLRKKQPKPGKDMTEMHDFYLEENSCILVDLRS